jgi:hypothetical protein
MLPRLAPGSKPSLPSAVNFAVLPAGLPGALLTDHPQSRKRNAMLNYFSPKIDFALIFLKQTPFIMPLQEPSKP